MTFLQAILIALIEGITEFLPISSTAHMVICSSMMNIEKDPFTKYFEVSIQLGAILSVLVLYFRRFIQFRSPAFYIKLGIAVIPSLLVGKLLNDYIDQALGSPVFIAWVMIGGGVLLIFLERIFRHPQIQEVDQMSVKLAFVVGCFQCLAILFPGLSRSAATILGAMSQRVSKSAAAEFSFFLAVPTMMAATGYKTLQYVRDYGWFTANQTQLIIVGNLVAFIVAIAAIRFFIRMVSSYGFTWFGIYRVLLGFCVLWLFRDAKGVH